MRLKPLRDVIVATPLEESGKVGVLYMPDNKTQGLATHYKALVLSSGPKADTECPPGTVIHVSERWGEGFQVGKRKYFVGRLRDINGIVPGERIHDTNKYLD